MRPNLLNSVLETIEAHYTSWDMVTPWPEPLITLTVALAIMNVTDRARLNRLAALAINSLEPLKREEYLARVDVSSDVRTAMLLEGDLPEKRFTEEATIADYQAAAIAKVNHKVSSIRQHFITNIVAQATIYRMKEDEAKAFLADSAPTEEAYPLIYAEVGSTAADANGVATEILLKAGQYRKAIAMLEKVRLGAIAKFETAGAIEAVSTALQEFQTELELTLAVIFPPEEPAEEPEEDPEA